MAFLNVSFTILAGLADSLKQPGAVPWEWLILQVFDFVINYGWRILLFTTLLKLALYPLELLQRFTMRKNQKITERIKPQLEKLEKAYGENKTVYQQKQMELQRREGYSYFMPCLPLLISSAIMIWMFTSLNTISRYMNMKQYLEMYDRYQVVYTQTGGDTNAAQDAVVTYYHDNKDKSGFLWVKNMWSADVPWTNPVKNRKDFLSAVGNYATKTSNYNNVSNDELNDAVALYDTVTEKLRQDSSIKTNGYLILVILAIGLSTLSMFVTQKQQKKSGMMPQAGAGGQAGTMKMLNFIMPVIMGIWALTSSAVFALYLVISYGTTLIFNFTTIGILKLTDNKKEKDQVVKVQKYGRPDPKDLLK